MVELTDNQKYRQLIETAHDLFMKYGLKRVSVEEICAEAKISKMTFYKYFKNKIDLAKFILNKIFREQMDLYRQTMAENITYPEKIKKVVLLKHKSTEMFSHEFFKDIWKKPVPEITDLLVELRKESLNEILNDFRKAQENGDIRKDINPNFIIYILNHLYELTKDNELGKFYNTPNELIMELTNFFFYGIMSGSENENDR